VGFVQYGKSKTEAMGLLLQNIDSPTPLTKLLSSKVAEDKRAEWSKRSEQYLEALHENGIVWGDAKAGNFIVDADAELWIIDFGGSYTEG
jgi:tRNA A-37 threonylcarbamoyl transferase component Bud32